MKTLDRVEPAGLARYKRKSVCAEEIDRLQPKQCSDSNGSIGNALRKQKPVVVEDAYEPDTHSEELPVEQLPVLRAGLDLQTVQFDKTGQPGWTLYDSVKGKYYRLGWLEFELLSRCNAVCLLFCWNKPMLKPQCVSIRDILMHC